MNNDPLARRVLVFPDPAAVARAAADELVRLLLAAVKTRGIATVALAGGSTPKAMFKLMAEPSFRDRIPWNDTRFFFGDERSVGPDHADSNYRMARETLFGPLGERCSEKKIHRIAGEMSDPFAAAALYEEELHTFFDGDFPRFDVILLGMGPDGHTASLFPGTTGLRETQKWAAAVWVDKLSTYRITLTPPVLRRARTLLFSAAGAEKQESLKAVLEGPAETDRYPSQGIVAEEGETLWLVDQAAAAGLSPA